MGEVVCRIIAKVVIGSDIQHAAGPLQLCAGQPSGVEAAIHLMRTLFTSDDAQGMLLVDASNAFNSLNKAVTLRNIQYICPPFSTLFMHIYRKPAPLYVNGDVIYTNEGTTHGDPLAIPFYALATLPLVNKLSKKVTQAWYANDTNACGKIFHLHTWWD